MPSIERFNYSAERSTPDTNITPPQDSPLHFDFFALKYGAQSSLSQAKVDSKNVMIQLGNRQLFFLHIPKTGGLTLRAILSRHFARRHVCTANGLGSFVRLSSQEIAQYRYFRGHLPYNITQLMPQPPVTITFLRDPLERTLSNYAYLRARNDLKLHPIAASHDLMGYLSHERVAHNQADMMTYYLGADFPVRGYPYRHKNLDLAMERLEKMAFVGITERYDDSIQLLTHTLQIPPVEQVEKRNASAERLRISDLSNDEYALIDEMTQIDQKLYAYAKSLFEERYQRFLYATSETRYPAQP